MKTNKDSWDARDKRIHRVEKGSRAGKYKKSLYNMLSDYKRIREASDNEVDVSNRNDIQR